MTKGAEEEAEGKNKKGLLCTQWKGQEYEQI